MTDHEPPADNAKRLADQIKAHPGLALAGGVALGMLASALMPKGSARKLAKGVGAAAALGGEASLALTRKAQDAARTAAGEASGHWRELEEKAGAGARLLRRRTAVAGDSAASAGLDFARAAMRLLGTLRR